MFIASNRPIKFLLLIGLFEYLRIYRPIKGDHKGTPLLFCVQKYKYSIFLYIFVKNVKIGNILSYLFLYDDFYFFWVYQSV